VRKLFFLFVDAHFSNSTRLHDTFFKKQALTSRYFSATVLTTISIMMRLPDRTFHPAPPTATSSLAQRQRQNQSQTSFRRSLFPLGGCALRFVKLSASVGAWGDFGDEEKFVSKKRWKPCS
jgi:hypothetical protein